MELCGDVTQRTAMQTAINELMIETEVLNPLSTYLEVGASLSICLFHPGCSLTSGPLVVNL